MTPIPAPKVNRLPRSSGHATRFASSSKPDRLQQPVTVFVRGGTYRIGTTLILGRQDSGTQAAPIVWQAAAGEEVRLCGGVVLSPDAFQPVRDEEHPVASRRPRCAPR